MRAGALARAVHKNVTKLLWSQGILRCSHEEISGNVAGPFTDPLGRDLAQSSTSNIDPTVFIDDDGQAYMYWGNGTLEYVRLNEDMSATPEPPPT